MSKIEMTQVGFDILMSEVAKSLADEGIEIKPWSHIPQVRADCPHSEGEWLYCTHTNDHSVKMFCWPREFPEPVQGLTEGGLSFRSKDELVGSIRSLFWRELPPKSVTSVYVNWVESRLSKIGLDNGIQWVSWFHHPAAGGQWRWNIGDDLEIIIGCEGVGQSDIKLFESDGVTKRSGTDIYHELLGTVWEMMNRLKAQSGPP